MDSAPTKPHTWYRYMDDQYNNIKMEFTFSEPKCETPNVSTVFGVSHFSLIELLLGHMTAGIKCKSGRSVSHFGSEKVGSIFIRPILTSACLNKSSDILWDITVDPYKNQCFW